MPASPRTVGIEEALGELIRVSKDYGMSDASHFTLPTDLNAQAEEISEAVNVVYRAIEAEAAPLPETPRALDVEALRAAYREEYALAKGGGSRDWRDGYRSGLDTALRWLEPDVMPRLAPARPADAALREAVAARRSRSAAPDVTCGCGDGGNPAGPFTLCAVHEKRWGSLTRDTLLNIVVDWEAAFEEVEAQLDAALAQQPTPAEDADAS